MNSLVLVANKSNEKYDVWTLADAAEYLHLQEKKMRRFKKEAKAIMKSCATEEVAGGICWRYL